MTRYTFTSCFLGLLLVVACNPGVLDTPSEDGSPDSSSDVCSLVTCPSGQHCVDGICRLADLCAGVTCPNTGEVCDPRTGACVAGEEDADGDGVTIADGDCDDGDDSIHPGAVEVCDGLDQDCDLAVDEGFDEDGDGITTCGGDCDDGETSVRPGAEEVCDGVDNDCSGAVDDGLGTRDCATECSSGVEQCEGGRWVCSASAHCDCLPGESESQTCGNCGDQSRSCQADSTWGAWSACSGEGVCSPGSTQACTACSQTGTQTCSGSCSWGSCVVSGCCSDGECGADQRCFSGDCSDFCWRTDGTQTCQTLCGWAEMTCRGAIVYDTGERSTCDVIDVRMDCYGI